MHSTSLLVTALVAAASLASADPAAKTATRPKIYFPRHVKRQFINATITSTESSSSSTQLSETKAGTTKKDLSDLFSDLFPRPSGTSSSSSTADSDPNVTTIVRHSTIYVTPTEAASTDASEATSSSTADSTSSPDATSDGSASTSGLPPIIILPTASSSTSESETTTSIASSTASSDETNSTATSDPVSSDVPTSTVATTTSGILLAPTGVVTPTSSSAGILDPLSTLISGIFSDVSTILDPSPTNATDPATTTAPISETFTLPGTGVTPTTTPDPTSSDPWISLTLSTGGTAPPPTSTLEPPPPVSSNTTTPSDPTPTPTPTGEPTNNGTVTELPPTVTSEPPVGPTVTPNNTLTDEPVPQTSTSSLPTVIPIPVNSTDIPTVVPTPAPTTVSASATTASGLTSLPAISTITNSDPWLAPTIIVQPSTSTLSGGGLAPTTTGGLPTGIPRAITPNSGLDPIPDGSVEIQIGFKYGLNYQFVAENPKAAAQVLWSVPELLSHAGSFDKSKAQMRRLIPLDTSANYGFVTTLAIATYPKTLVDQLRLDIHAPNSRVYNNPNQLVYNVSELINPAIDIIVGSGVDGGATGTGGGSSSTSTSNPNGDVFNDNGSDQSSGKRGETVGIAMGAIVISVAYGTAMFIVARRYKRKKQGHRRASSISTPATSMRQTPSPVMGGALLSRDFSSYGGVAGGRDSHGSGRSNMNNSGRTAFISAPVAAENSLGWN